MPGRPTLTAERHSYKKTPFGVSLLLCKARKQCNTCFIGNALFFLVSENIGIPEYFNTILYS
jgi:hypothetical protein